MVNPKGFNMLMKFVGLSIEELDRYPVTRENSIYFTVPTPPICNLTNKDSFPLLLTKLIFEIELSAIFEDNK